jgi:hypothetical protein
MIKVCRHFEIGIGMSAFGPFASFRATQYFGRVWGEADMNRIYEYTPVLDGSHRNLASLKSMIREIDGRLKTAIEGQYQRARNSDAASWISGLIRTTHPQPLTLRRVLGGTRIIFDCAATRGAAAPPPSHNALIQEDKSPQEKIPNYGVDSTWLYI